MADGSKIPNEGQILAKLETTHDNAKRGMKVQICDSVKTPVLSVRKAVEHGHSFVFQDGGGYIVHDASGHRTPFRQENGTYHVDMWVRYPRFESGFTRLEK